MLKENQSIETQQCHPGIKRQQYRIKISRFINSCPRQKTSLTQVNSQTTTSRKSNFEDSNKNRNFHQKRRQNHLNSLFKIRKQKLESITKFNKDLYVRLNSQQSRYAPLRTSSRDKQQIEKQQFTFRTINSRQSRQILGPIINLNSGSLFYLKQKFGNFEDQKQNNLRGSEICNSQKLLKIQSQHNTPLRRRKIFNQDPQNVDLPMSSKPKGLFSGHYQNGQFYSKVPYKTPQRRSKLPDLYSFF